MSISKKVTSASISHYLKLLLIPLLISCLCLTAWFTEKHKYIFSEDNIFYLPAEEIKTDTYYKFDLYEVFDYYEYDSKGKYYLTDISDYDNTFCYIGFYFPDEYEDKINAIMDNTWSYYDGGSDDGSHIKGLCYAELMDQTDRGYFHDYFSEAGYETDNLVYINLIYVPDSDLIDDLIFMPLISGLVTLEYFIFLLYLILSKKYKADFLRQVSEYSMSLEQLDSYMVNSAELDKVYFGSTYLVNTCMRPFVVSYADIRWTYCAPNLSSIFSKKHIVVIKTDREFLFIANRRAEFAKYMQKEIEKRAINLDTSISPVDKVTCYRRFANAKSHFPF